jgi:hypothetical protein
MDAGACVLWPQREDLYELMKLRCDIGRTAFACEKQGTPLAADLCEWPESYFDESVWFSDWPREAALRVLALDPSKGADSRVGDYSAFISLAIAGELVYIDAELVRCPAESLIDRAVGHVRSFQPHAFVVEGNDWQDLLAGEFYQAFGRAGLFAARPLPVVNTVPKQVRIRRLGPFLAGRQFRFHARSPGAAMLVDQLRDFPLGEHDDGPDALELALRQAAEFHATPSPPWSIGGWLA